MTTRTTKNKNRIQIAFGAFALLLVAELSLAQTSDPFSTLRGNWGGSGTMTLDDGEKARLSCTAQYTGSASQLGLAIKCKSSFNEISMKAKLSANAGRLLGTWEEATYKAIGSISGIATEDTINFYIAGNVLGTMRVKYTKSNQEVLIRTTGVSLKDVSIKLKRR